MCRAMGRVWGDRLMFRSCTALAPLSCCPRLCLTYNLRLKGTSGGTASPPAAQSPGVSSLAGLLQQWEADPKGPPFLVFPLEHRWGCYTL
jgi:hypothetical protein